MTSIRLHIGTSLADLTPVWVAPEQIFGRHCAVVGSSGGGKSWSLARVLEQAGAYQSKIVLLDASGEFSDLNESTFHLHLGTAMRDDVNSAPATLPYFELSEQDLLTLFQPSDTVQWIKLRSAIKTLKLLQLCPSLAASGVLVKAHKHKQPFEDAHTAFKKQLERPQSIFNVHKLPAQIDLECVHPVRSHTEFDHWGGISLEEQAACIPLINRIEDLLRTPELSPLFNPPPGPSIFEALEQFLTDPTISILRISMEFLPAGEHIRKIVVDALARNLLAIARAGALRSRPVVIALDEAHQVTTKAQHRGLELVPTSALETIAKEGRKYGLTLCLATQRPGDIPESLLSQVGALIVHRLVSPTDLAAVETAAGGLDAHTLSSIPRLAPGESLLIGMGSRDPLHVKMLAPKSTPHSFGPDYQRTWIRRTSTVE